MRVERVQAIARHALCILALMWLALANGQGFFFPDTTSYVRAADAAVYSASHGRITTAWTSRYKQGGGSLVAPKAADVAAPLSDDAGVKPAAGNDVSSGNVMAGRSPYFGALLYAAYVASNFWLFILAQAAVAYALLVLALRHFRLDSPKVTTGVVTLLAVGTGLPYFNSLLMPDALAAFGIVAFLLIATDRGEFARPTLLFLWLVMAASAVSHLTHVVMLIAMLAIVAVVKLAGWMAISRRSLVAGLNVVVIGILSIMLTSAMIKIVFKKPPQLVPLMTARFIADGAGADFIRQGCDGQKFVVCGLPLHHASSDNFLWSEDPNVGTFLMLSPQQRSQMSAEDTKFGLAVLKAYPIRQGGMLVVNTIKQMLWFPDRGLNVGCFDQPGCWKSLPATVRDTLKESPSGKSLFPIWPITYFHYAVVIAAILIFAARITAVRRKEDVLGKDIILWAVLFVVAMLVCDALGGAISAPQYRYQGRIIWLVPLLAAIVALLDWQSSSAGRGKAGIAAPAGEPA